MTKDDISKIRMTLGEWGEKKNVRAMATVTFSNGVSIRGIRMLNGSYGLFPGMPSRKNEETGRWEPHIYFEESEDWKDFSSIMSNEYEKLLAEEGKTSSGKKVSTESFQKNNPPQEEEDLW